MSQRLKDLKAPALIAVAVTLAAIAVSAIVVKSPRLASPEPPVSTDKRANLEIPTPALLAEVLLAPSEQNPAEGEAAAATTFFDANGKELTLSAFKGQGLVLNLWATWCAPCVHEMPALDALADKLKDRGVRVVALSEDRKALEVVPPFYAAKGIKALDLYYDTKSRLSRALGVSGLPTTVLIDAQGREIARVKGAIAWDDDSVVEFLVRALAAP